MSDELFSFLQQDFRANKLRLGILTKRDTRMNALDPFAYRNYFNRLAVTNKKTALFEADGGYSMILPPTTLEVFEIAAQPDPPLVADPTLDDLEKRDKGLLRVAHALTTIKTHKVEVKKRSDEAGIMVAQAIIPTILPEAIAHLTSKWAAEMSTDHFSHMNEILEYIGTFQKNYSEIAELLIELLDEITVARSHTDIYTLMAKFEGFKNLQEECLTRLVLDDRIPLDTNYPPKTDAYILKRMIKKIAVNDGIARYRNTVQAWITKDGSLDTLTTKIRKQLLEYNPPEEQRLAIRTNQTSTSTHHHDYSASRSVALDNTIYQECDDQWETAEQDQLVGNVDTYMEPSYQPPAQDHIYPNSFQEMDHHHFPQVRAQVGRPLERTYQLPAGSQPSMWHEMYQPPSQRQRVDVPVPAPARIFNAQTTYRMIHTWYAMQSHGELVCLESLVLCCFVFHGAVIIIGFVGTIIRHGITIFTAQM